MMMFCLIFLKTFSNNYLDGTRYHQVPVLSTTMMIPQKQLLLIFSDYNTTVYYDTSLFRENLLLSTISIKINYFIEKSHHHNDDNTAGAHVSLDCSAEEK